MTQNIESKPRLLTFRSGGWVLLGAAILSALAALQLFWPMITGQQIHRLGNGVDVNTYGFNLDNSLVPKSDIVASGMSKDGLRAMIDPPMWTVVQLDAMDKRQGHLVSNDVVIGVSAGPESTAEARAYPLATMDLHEIVNDTLASQPIVVTYNPLCGSCVVFARDGNTTFGLSGLLYQSNLLMYDKAIRQTKVVPESLWSQLQFRAVAGDAAVHGGTLALVPFEVTTWAGWKSRHPNTLVLARDPALNDEYNHNRYGSYFASDEIKFPVTPLWNDGQLAKKTRVLAVRVNNKWTVYTLPKLIQSADASGHWSTTQSGVKIEFAVDPETQTAHLVAPPPNVIVIPCFLFAWYAQHPDNLVLVN